MNGLMKRFIVFRAVLKQVWWPVELTLPTAAFQGTLSKPLHCLIWSQLRRLVGIAVGCPLGEWEIGDRSLLSLAELYL